VSTRLKYHTIDQKLRFLRFGTVGNFTVGRE